MSQSFIEYLNNKSKYYLIKYGNFKHKLNVYLENNLEYSLELFIHTRQFIIKITDINSSSSYTIFNIDEFFNSIKDDQELTEIFEDAIKEVLK